MGFSKAQASAEYLSNYAIAAIIIVIVLAAFTYLGWLFPNRPPICIFQNGLECDSHYIKLGSDMVSVKVYNRFPDAIVVSGVLCSSEAINPATSLPPSRQFNDPASNLPSINGGPLPQTVMPGASFDISTYCFTETGAGAGSLTRQDRFQGIVFLKYRLNSSPSLFTHIIQGNLQDTPQG